MEFLKSCAEDLDKGKPAEEVLEMMRKRYSTATCLKVKTCEVRKLCSPCPLHVKAFEEETRTLTPHAKEAVRTAARTRILITRNEEVDAVLKRLPPYLPKNARDLHVSSEEFKDCKKRAILSRLEKNRMVAKVNGRDLLDKAREMLVSSERVPHLALSLMLLTGRRTCEILSGRSSFRAVNGFDYAVQFVGQAKRKGFEGAYNIPVLEKKDVILSAYERLRDLQKKEMNTNSLTSRKYQSLLSRTLCALPLFQDARRPHGLRGAYACMCLKAFEWGSLSNSFVTMTILGHRDIEESLVYTAYDVGRDFDERLGDGCSILTA